MATMRAKAIIPKNINATAMIAALTKEMQAIHKEVDKDFNDTVKPWDNKPAFKREFSATTNRIRFYTGSADEIYGYVSKGTKPHRIVPKRAKALRFQGKYRAKTSPGRIVSGAGGASGAVIYSQGVMHPGTKARNFDEQIGKKWERDFPRRMNGTMRQVAKQSGHSR